MNAYFQNRAKDLEHGFNLVIYILSSEAELLIKNLIRC